MNIRNLFFLFFCLVFLSSCAHVSQKIHRLPVKSSKTKILKTLGRPFKVERKRGMDYWTYKFTLERKPYTQTVIIKEGLLYRKERVKPLH